MGGTYGRCWDIEEDRRHCCSWNFYRTAESFAATANQNFNGIAKGKFQTASSKILSLGGVIPTDKFDSE